MEEPSMVLRIDNITVKNPGTGDVAPLIRDVTLSVAARSILGLVGGSGSGKTTTGLAVLRLLPPPLHLTGAIHFRETDLLTLSPTQMSAIRGKKIGMIFQDPLQALNPVFTIGYQIDEVLRCHTDLGKKARRENIHHLLDRVGLQQPKQIARKYPHQLSGGMRQRAMIAQAVAAGPALLIADEPTSSLDVTLQAGIMALFDRLRREMALSILLITHDLGMVGHLADHVAVMSKGHIVEQGETLKVVHHPDHEYTRQLMEAVCL